MKYMTVMEAAQKWGISDRRVRFLCSQGRIRGMIQQGRRYLIPDTTEKPRDERVRNVRGAETRKYNDFTRLDFLKNMMTEFPDDLGLIGWDPSFLHQFTWSCALEAGATFSQKEVDEILAGNVIVNHSLHEHMMVIGCHDAMQYGQSCACGRKPLSQNSIRTIHSLLLLDDPLHKGRYRKVKVYLRETDLNPIFLDLIEPQVNDLLNINTQRKKTMHPIERIARLYAEFQGLHPFQKGNGRTAQVLLNIELMENGYPPIVVYDPCDKDFYFKALWTFLDTNDSSLMIRFISQKVELAMECYISSFRKRKSVKKPMVPALLWDSTYSVSL